MSLRGHFGRWVARAVAGAGEFEVNVVGIGLRFESQIVAIQSQVPPDCCLLRKDWMQYE